MSVAVKRCPKCGQTKSVKEFYRNRNHKDGLATHCKTCAVEYIKAWSAKCDAKTVGYRTLPPQKTQPIVKQAIATFGKEHQLKKIAEECSEFIKAWMDYTEGRPGAYEAMVDELADLFVTAWQGRLIVGAKTLDYAIDRKLEKLTREMEAVEDDLK